MFPQKTRWLKNPIGWEDLGRREGKDEIKNGHSITNYFVHQFCNTQVNVGKEDNELFLFCPRCLIKTEQSIKK